MLSGARRPQRASREPRATAALAPRAVTRRTVNHRRDRLDDSGLRQKPAPFPAGAARIRLRTAAIRTRPSQPPESVRAWPGLVSAIPVSVSAIPGCVRATLDPAGARVGCDHRGSGPCPRDSGVRPHDSRVEPVGHRARRRSAPDRHRSISDPLRGIPSGETLRFRRCWTVSAAGRWTAVLDHRTHRRDPETVPPVRRSAACPKSSIVLGIRCQAPTTSTALDTPAWLSKSPALLSTPE